MNISIYKLNIFIIEFNNMQFIKLSTVPEKNIFFCKEEKTYMIKALPAQLKLLIDEKNKFPEGWCLLKASIKRLGSNLRAKLIFKSEKEIIEYKIPIGCNGIIFELFKIPSKTKEILFEPMNSIGKFEIIEDFYIKPVGKIERTYIILRRILFLFLKKYQNTRKILKFPFYWIIFNLQKAYQLLNIIRDCNFISDYSKWIEFSDKLTEKEIKKIKKDIGQSKLNQIFYIFIINQDEKEYRKTMKSLETQLYKNFIVKSLKNKSDIQQNEFPVNSRIDGTYFIFLKAGDLLPPHSLYWIAKEARASDADLIYTDHDYINSISGRSNPQFKPDFSLEYLRSKNFIDFAFAVKAELLLKIENIDIKDILEQNSHSLLLKIIEKTSFSKIKHIPAILFHLANEKLSVENNINMKDNPVKEHLKRLGVQANVERINGHCYKIIYHITSTPLISIIIPTKDQFIVIKRCIESIIEKTSYCNYEIIIVDNQSTDKKTIEYLESLSGISKVRILKFNKAYDFSAINNFASRKAKGEVLLFLNNDTEVITHQWLEIMLGCLQQPDVGAVGAKLYYPCGQIQHAGVILGPGGCADHAFKGFVKEERGYMDRAMLQQEYSAVTAACMMTWKQIFIKLGGFDEINLSISFNDVDYCLKLREAGYKIIFTPYVELYHHESLSRGKNLTEEYKSRSKKEADFIRKKWKRYIEYDPFYNPNLNYKRPDFSLNLFPKIKKPWNRNG